MSRYRSKLWLGVWAFLVLTGMTAFAQDVPNSAMADFELFDPQTDSGFGGGRPLNQGYFFSWEALYWAILAPDVTPVGNANFPTRTVVNPFGPADIVTRLPIPTVQFNTFDTGYIESNANWGQRIEFGDIVGHQGWMVGVTALRDQNQNVYDGTNLTMTFDALRFGATDATYLSGLIVDPLSPIPGASVVIPLPVTFSTFNIENSVDFWSVDALYILRSTPMGFNRSLFGEIFLGARYMELDERFQVWAAGGSPFTTALSSLEWRSMTENHIVGPEVGLRLFTQRKRWTFSAESRFIAGANFLTVRQDGSVTPNFIARFASPADFQHIEHKTEFSPAIETRLGAKVRVSRGFELEAGWTGMWIDNVQRASRAIDYTFAEDRIFGIETHLEDVFLHGLTFGVIFNR